MATVNDFQFDLYVDSDRFIPFRFIDALSLLRNSSRLSSILTKIDSNMGRNIDIKNLGKVALSSDQILWSFVALAAIAEYPNLLAARAVDEKVPVDDLFEAAKASGFSELAAIVPRNLAWRGLVDLVGVHSRGVRGNWGDGATYVMWNVIGKSPNFTQQVAYEESPNFKDSVLLGNAHNLLVNNFEFMKRRFVDTSCARAGSVFLSAKSKKGVLLCNTPLCATLSGQASWSLLGFSEAIVGNSAISEDLGLDLGDTQRAMFEAGDILSRSGVKIPANSLDPNRVQVKEIVRLSEQIALPLLERPDFDNVASEILEVLDASADILLNDPNSPYSGKGFTRKDISTIALQGMFGSGGAGAIAEAVQRGLETCMRQIDAVDAMLKVMETKIFTGDSVRSDIEALKESREGILEDYDKMLAYASILFDIEGPQVDELARRNGEPSTMAMASLALLAVGVLSVIIFGVLQIIRARRERTCAKLTHAEQSAHTSALQQVHKALEGPNDSEKLNEFFKLLDSAQIKISSSERILKENECTSHFVQSFDCLSVARNGSQSQQARLEVIRNCLSAEGTRLEKEVAAAEKRADELDEQNPLTAWNKFIANIFNQATTVFTYAAYTALALGVIWGAGKVYRALKPDSDQ